jgi:hypothetical protein
LDFVVESDEFIQVVAPNNGSANRPLLANSFNAIAVGCSDGEHPRGTVNLDSQYTSGRTKPDVVAPFTYTSSTAPIAASSVGLLLETGRSPSLATDPNRTYTTNRSGQTIYNGERSEVIKAALMAGANRVPPNAGITAYSVDPANRSPNRLDVRYGAGQLDIYQSYHIIAAGERNSAEDYPSGGGNIGWYGFDFDPFFGGLEGSNNQASYYFVADQNHRMLAVSLVWNIDIHGGVWNNFNSSAVLYNLDLFLHDVTDPANPRLVASSQSALDNTENLWAPLSPGRRYRIQVKPGQGQAAFKWDYALAWRIWLPSDRDGDTMPDDWEVYSGLNHTDPSDGAGDSDGDGLSNAAEYSWGTDPRNPDSDGDGFPDGVEVNAGSNPLDPGSKPIVVSVPAMNGPMLLLAAIVALLAGKKLSPSSRGVSPGVRLK